jgi:signal transduction histidine kinase
MPGLSTGMPQRLRCSAAAPIVAVTLIVVASLVALGATILHQKINQNLPAALARDYDSSSTALRHLDRMMELLRRAEANDRAYLLGGDPHYRDEFRESASTVAADIATLRNLPEVDAAALDDIAVRIGERLDRFAAGIARYDAGKREEAVAIVLATPGGGQMQAIQDAVESVADTIRARLKNRQINAVAKGVSLDESLVAAWLIAAILLSSGICLLVWHLHRHVQMERGLERGRDAALQLARDRMRILATASHDLRQPLQAIGLFTGALRRRLEDPASLRIVNGITDAAGSMQRMFAALLDIARLDAGIVTIHPETVPLETVFAPMRSEFTPRAAGKGLTLSIPASDLAVLADRAAVETMLRNLLSNALTYTAEGSVTVTAGRHEGIVAIDVTDTGCGIPADQIDVIFEEFRRFGPRAGSDGLGLGLAIVRRVAALTEARVEVRSEPGAGSTFTILLPHAQTATATGTAAGVDAAERTDAVLAGRRILVLDDDPAVLAALTAAVESWNATPLPAATIEDAVSLLRRLAPLRPDAAVIDLNLEAGHSGLAFLDSPAAGGPMPAVIITGTTDRKNQATARADPRPWLIKPVDSELLRRTLHDLLAPPAA